MARDGMGSIVGIAAVAGLAYWAYSSGLLNSLMGGSSVAPHPATPVNPASGAGTNATQTVAPQAPPACSGAGILAPLLAHVKTAQGANGASFGPLLPGTLTIDEWGYYLNELCTGMADQWKVNADSLFPGKEDRGGPLNWSAFEGHAKQAGLSGPRRIARGVTRGRILRRVA